MEASTTPKISKDDRQVLPSSSELHGSQESGSAGAAAVVVVAVELLEDDEANVRATKYPES